MSWDDSTATLSGYVPIAWQGLSISFSIGADDGNKHITSDVLTLIIHGNECPKVRNIYDLELTNKVRYIQTLTWSDFFIHSDMGHEDNNDDVALELLTPNTYVPIENTYNLTFFSYYNTTASTNEV